MKQFIFICIIILSVLACKEGKKHNKVIEIEIGNENIIVNPFSVAPLSAVIQVEADRLHPKKVKEIRVKVTGKPEDKKGAGIDISDTLYPQTESFKTDFFDITEESEINNTVITTKNKVEIPVLGLYADYDRNRNEKLLFYPLSFYQCSTDAKRIIPFLKYLLTQT
ncbi:MAG: hypothetical protein PVF73_02595 [Bacteroidales bacterium]|jgi:hypothetical protein